MKRNDILNTTFLTDPTTDANIGVPNLLWFLLHYHLPKIWSS